MIELWHAAWYPADLGEALLALAEQAGLAPRGAAPSAAPETAAARDLELDAWLDVAAEALGIRLQPVECRHAELEAVLSQLGPALVRIEGPDGARYLAVLRSRRRATTLLTPQCRRVRVQTRALRAAVALELDAEGAGSVEAWIAAAQLNGRAARRAREALGRFVVSERRVGKLWLLEVDPGASFATQLRCRGTLRRATAFVAVSIAQVALSILAWAAIGRSALAGSADPGWLHAWGLGVLCTAALQAVAVWLGGRVLLEVASLLKRRLLCGALRAGVDSIRSLGSGLLLAKVGESEAIESAGLMAGLGALVALIQIGGGVLLLALGAGGIAQVLSLFAWTGVVGWSVASLARSRARWTGERFELAHGFLENVRGQRTRVVQQRPERWHDGEDEQLLGYLLASRDMDRADTRLRVLAAEGWLLVGLATLIPAALHPDSNAADLAIAVGGILQAHGGFRTAAASAALLCRAALAWSNVGELFSAAATLPAPAQVAPPPDRPRAERSPLLDVRGLSYRYPGRSTDALRDVSLRLWSGERLLVEGSSGGGKSTLAALLVGVREPQTGCVLFRSLDRSLLGAATWRRCVASAPQFQENHILSGSLAFNVLLGRRWPAPAEDLADAHQVCAELGLGPLIERMPAGIHQVVGEAGWQLSHGERSRVFLARALLQDSEVLVLDETFGALDPVGLQQCLDTVLKRARTLIVIAHP